MAVDSSSSLVVLCPTRGRPHFLEPLARTFAETTTDYRFLWVVDDDDPESEAAAREVGNGDLLVTDKRGYPAKVNAGIRASTEPLIFLGSDDIRPHPGWLETAKSYLSDKIGYVSLNDLGNEHVMRGEYATMVLVARWYAELDEELYHEGYYHNGADLEASALAKKRGAFVYAPDAIMEHLHPSFGKGEMDETYREWAYHRGGIKADRRLLEQRRRTWA